MLKNTLVLKDRLSSIKLYKTYLEFSKCDEKFVLAYKFLSTVYITNQTKIPIQTLLSLSKIVSVFFIDHKGFVVGELRKK